MFPIRNGLKQVDALTPLLLNYALMYAIRKVQVSQDRLKLNGTHQLLVYAVNINILEEATYYKRKLRSFFMASNENGLEINADKTKYMLMSRDQNPRRSHSIKNYNRSFARLEEFKCLPTTLTNQNSIQEEIKSRLNSWNACYHSVQNLLSSRLLLKI
jgi:hypothetical protein